MAEGVSAQTRREVAERAGHRCEDRWDEHFSYAGGRIIGKTETGAATASLLRMNESERVSERRLLQRLGEYPDVS